MKIHAPQKEEMPLMKNGWILIHDHPLSMELKNYLIQKKLEDFFDDEAEEYMEEYI